MGIKIQNNYYLSYEQQIIANKKKIEDLRKQVLALEGKIAEIDMDVLLRRLENLEGELTRVSGEVEDIYIILDAYEDAIIAATTKVNELANTVEEVTTKVDEEVTKINEGMIVQKTEYTNLFNQANVNLTEEVRKINDQFKTTVKTSGNQTILGDKTFTAANSKRTMSGTITDSATNYNLSASYQINIKSTGEEIAQGIVIDPICTYLLVDGETIPMVDPRVTTSKITSLENKQTINNIKFTRLEGNYIDSVAIEMQDRIGEIIGVPLDRYLYLYGYTQGYEFNPVPLCPIGLANSDSQKYTLISDDRYIGIMVRVEGYNEDETAYLSFELTSTNVQDDTLQLYVMGYLES